MFFYAGTIVLYRSKREIFSFLFLWHCNRPVKRVRFVYCRYTFKCTKTINIIVILVAFVNSSVRHVRAVEYNSITFTVGRLNKEREKKKKTKPTATLVLVKKVKRLICLRLTENRGSLYPRRLYARVRCNVKIIASDFLQSFLDHLIARSTRRIRFKIDTLYIRWIKKRKKKPRNISISII